MLRWLLVLLVGCVSSGVYDPEAAFLRVNPAYHADGKQLNAALEAQKARLFAAEKAGRDVTCARQIAEEAGAALDAEASLAFAR
jgi:hypothetical protein